MYQGLLNKKNYKLILIYI